MSSISVTRDRDLQWKRTRDLLVHLVRMGRKLLKHSWKHFNIIVSVTDDSVCHRFRRNFPESQQPWKTTPSVSFLHVRGVTYIQQVFHLRIIYICNVSMFQECFKGTEKMCTLKITGVVQRNRHNAETRVIFVSSVIIISQIFDFWREIQVLLSTFLNFQWFPFVG